jgi:hypothetical protein
MTDITNSLLHNEFWDYNTLYNSLSDDLEDPLSLDDNVPFHPAKDLSVTLPDNLLGYADIYIDDIIGITPDLGDNTKRLSRAIPLAIYSIARPTNDLDVIPRKDIISMKKFKVEGCLEEVKKVLGWILNTRTLTLSLPHDKLRDWSHDISKMISGKKSHFKSLESILGKLNHVACSFPPMRHYMGRLYQALQRSSLSKGWTSFSAHDLRDLDMMLLFLNKAANGISLNYLVFRKPDFIYHSDASEFGIGGYNILSGVAWRIELPIDCRLCSSINSLEFIGCVINIWIDHFHQLLHKEACILSQTDSTTALGWLKKSDFSDKSEELVQLSTARKLADIILESETCLFSQWFPGEHNSIADSLSRDFHISNSHLCHLLLSHFPEQTPFGLTILPVPPDIVSWLTCMLRSQLLETLWSKEPTRSKFALGLGSSSTWAQSAWEMTGTSTTSHNSSELKSSVHLLTHSKRVDWVLETVVRPSSPTLSEPPWTVYHRPSSWLTDQIPDWTGMANLQSFSKDNLEDTIR